MAFKQHVLRHSGAVNSYSFFVVVCLFLKKKLRKANYNVFYSLLCTPCCCPWANKYCETLHVRFKKNYICLHSTAREAPTLHNWLLFCIHHLHWYNQNLPAGFPSLILKKKHVRALMVQYAIPNAGTGRQRDEQLKLWIHGQGSSNVLSPILIHFIHWVILKKLPFHVHDLMLQNKRNGFQLYWKR